ncbi:hypothetical protein NicSoilB8_07790 [Arthrobacter sp. NicSoilB8]|nr:hypothetical protein NicSoilB8_07790 [Arthrobacter sp. NicSoilB8]
MAVTKTTLVAVPALNRVWWALNFAQGAASWGGAGEAWRADGTTAMNPVTSAASSRLLEIWRRAMAQF